MDRHILDLNYSKKYYIQYRNYLCNHLPHGVVALCKLGASQDQINQFVTWYSDRLEKPDGPSSQLHQSEEHSTEKLLGAEANFYQLVEHYNDKYKSKYNSDVELLVRSEYPNVAKGMMGAVLHPLIDIGYGLLANSAKTVIDGLAHQHMTYVPLITTETSVVIGKGNQHVVDVLLAFSKCKEILVYIENEEKEGRWKDPFIQKVCKMVRNMGDILLLYTCKIEINLCPETSTMADIISLARNILDWTIFLYAKSEQKNDFYLLHGVTGAWALQQILYTYKDKEKSLIAIQTFLCCLLATYVCHGSPALNATIDPDKLIYSDWDVIIQATFKKLEAHKIPDYDHPSQYDEHVYKVIQILYALAKKTGPTDFEKNNLYKAAANRALNNVLYFLNVPKFDKFYTSGLTKDCTINSAQ